MRVDRSDWKQTGSQCKREGRKGEGANNNRKRKKKGNVAEKKGKLSLSCQMLHAPLRGSMANFIKMIMFSYRLSPTEH